MAAALAEIALAWLGLAAATAATYGLTAHYFKTRTPEGNRNA
jgi:hypothetical protein